jgi:MoaA/NifB/PqqE/SkfB family radical SAM enzyme
LDIQTVVPQDLNSYCPELWSRAYISQQNNQFAYKPCCYFRPNDNDTLSDFTNIYRDLNQKHQTIRIKNLQGIKDTGCNYCYESESSIGNSARTRAIERQGTKVQLISHLDLNLGTLCNLSCAICGPFNSSNWVPIAEQGWGSIDPIFKYRPKDRPVIDDPDLFRQLKTVQLQGGEIFLESGYQTFFENMGKYRSYNDLSVMIFTNGTVKPTTEFTEILNRCSDVKIFFSVDDIGQRFEYQRRGAKWEEVLANINWFNANTNATLGFNITYSMFNIYYLKDLYNFLINTFPELNRNYSAFNSGMANCSAEHQTAEVKQYILDSVAQISELSFLNNYIKESIDPYTEFKSYITKYDSITKTSYPNTHLEFWELINTTT